MGPHSFTEPSVSFDELDDTKNDSNYDPNKSTSPSSDQLKEKEILLPTIRRPKIRSMKREISAENQNKETGAILPMLLK